MAVRKKVVPLQPQKRKDNVDANKLGYGVMVTLQILVLPFLVRIRVPQQDESNHIRGWIFLCNIIGSVVF